MAAKRRLARAPRSTLSTSSTAPPLDLVAAAERQRLAWLLGRMKARKSLSTGQRRELALLEARHGGGGPVGCQAGAADGRPYLVLPPGYSVAVSTEEQLAEPFAVDARTVRLWRAKPGWPAPARGPYLLAGSLPEFLRSLRERPEAAEPSELDKWAAEVKRQRALGLEQERLQAEGKLVAWERVRERDKKLWGRFKAMIQAANREFAGLATHICREMDRLETELLSGPFPSGGDSRG